MIGNPLALLGLLTIAVPVIIHLLGRRQSRVLRFPTLRFIGASRLVPTRRRRISDLPLLIVRAGIVAAAAIALSQPWLGWADQRADRRVARSVSRVIVLDTSESMRRPTTGEQSASDSARRLAASLQNAATVTKVIETSDVATSIEGASAWLDTRPGMREITVISDFQPSVLDDGAVARIPKDVGLDLLTIPASGPVPSTRSAVRPRLEATEKDARGVEIAWAAIGEPTPWDTTKTTGRVTVRYKDMVASNGAVREWTPIDVPWMGTLLATLERDPTLRAAARSARPFKVVQWPDVVARNDAGQAIVIAEKTEDCLCLSVLDEPASLTSAALNRALILALNPPIAGAEVDTARIGGETLARWKRDATPVPGDNADPTDARWFWIAALLLLALETWMRSRRRADLGIAPAGYVNVERAA